MGSTVSIANETNCILNVALKKGTPLYYENKVLPGQIVKRDVGKISFSLEARLWNGTNDYDDFSGIYAPITSISSAAASSLRSLAANAGLVNQLMDDHSLRDNVLMGKVILPVGAGESTQKIIGEWISDAAVRENGIWMTSDTTLRICGGPVAYIDDGNDYQYVENTEAFTILR